MKDEMTEKYDVSDILYTENVCIYLTKFQNFKYASQIERKELIQTSSRK